MLRRSPHRTNHGTRVRSKLSNPFPLSTGLTVGSLKITGVACDDVCKTIAEYVFNHQHVLVLGTPASGKSTAARRLATVATQHGFESAKYYQANQARDRENFCEDAQTAIAAVNEQHRKSGTDISTEWEEIRPKLFILDEAHEAFEMIPRFESEYLKNAPIPIAFFGTSAATASTATPQDLRHHKKWFFGPTVDRGEVVKYIEQMYMAFNVDFSSPQRAFAESLFDICGGHMDTIVKAVQYTEGGTTF